MREVLHKWWKEGPGLVAGQSGPNNASGGVPRETRTERQIGGVRRSL